MSGVELPTGMFLNLTLRRRGQNAVGKREDHVINFICHKVPHFNHMVPQLIIWISPRHMTQIREREAGIP